MKFTIEVPPGMLKGTNMNLGGLDAMLYRVLVMELFRRGAVERGAGAASLNMTEETFEAAVKELRVPAAGYASPAGEAVMAAEPKQGAGTAVKVLATLLVLVVISFAAYLAMGDKMENSLNIKKAEMKLAAGDTEEAIALYEKVLAEDEGNKEACAAVGAIYVEKGHALKDGGDEDGAKKMYRESLVYLEKVVSGSRDANLVYDAATANEMTGNKERAIELYEKALEIDPALDIARVSLDNLRRNGAGQN